MNKASQHISIALKKADIVHENEEYPDLTDNAKVVLERRYLSKDREGNVLEDADGMFRRVARDLSLADFEYGATEEERQATCLLYTSPSPRDRTRSRMPSSA